MTFSAERRVQLVKSSLSDFVRIGQLFREMPNCDLFRNEADRRPLPENWTDCIEVVTFSGDPFKAAAAAGADVFIADPSENYAPSPENSYFLEQIGRYCGHSPQLFTVPADICEETFLYMSALQVKRALPQQFVCFGRPRSYAFSHGRVGDLLPAKRLAERKSMVQRPKQQPVLQTGAIIQRSATLLPHYGSSGLYVGPAGSV